MLKIIFGGVKGFIQPLMNKMYCLNLLCMSGQVLVSYAQVGFLYILCAVA